MDYTTLSIPTDEGKRLEPVAVASLYQALHQLSDARRSQGKRYELALILCLLVLAKLAGETSLSGATEWMRHHAALLAEQFGLRRTSMPCQMTYCNVLARVDGKHLDEILAPFCVRWEAAQRCGAAPSRLHTPPAQADHAHLAIDGKPLRATTSQPHPVHQLSCDEVATGIVFWHCNVQEKENEISALKPLLTPQVIKGRIFTLDAMHTQRALCAQIHRFEGDDLLIAKDKQPTLHEDIADLFEHRQITCSPDLNDWFGKQWVGIEQVFRLERPARLLRTNQTRHEVVYGLSSLSMRQASPARMLSLVRDHWTIENKLH
jgi:predicted transposase YbfD/YdcC